eukprot:s1440_g10.t1
MPEYEDVEEEDVPTTWSKRGPDSKWNESTDHPKKYKMDHEDYANYQNAKVAAKAMPSKPKVDPNQASWEWETNHYTSSESKSSESWGYYRGGGSRWHGARGDYEDDNDDDW